MKFVTTPSVLCLTIFLVNRCSGSVLSLSKRFTKESTSYIMPQHVDDTKPAMVYSSSGDLAYTITSDLNLGRLTIKDSQGKNVVDAVAMDNKNCEKDYKYTLTDKSAYFTLGPTRKYWEVADKGTFHKLFDEPQNNAEDPYERNLLTGDGTIDTIITSSPESSDVHFPAQPINTIQRSTESTCPVEYTIALLVVRSKREAQCGRLS